jgi:hypothetical protein
MVSAFDIVWLAGLLEGEGHFHYHRSVTSPKICLQMSDADVVERAARLLRSRVKRYPPRTERHQAMYQLTGGHDSAGWMMTLLPFMGERRRRQIIGALEQWRKRPAQTRYRHSCPRGHALSPRAKTGRRYCVPCDRARQARQRRLEGKPVRIFKGSRTA